MTPPDLDLPPRPVPRAPITDVVPRRTLLIIAVVVALAVIGTVLAIAFSGDDKGANGAKSGSASRAVASDSAPADTKEDDSGGAHTDGETSKSASAGSKSGDTAGTGVSASGGSAATVDGSGGSGEGAVAKTHQGGQGYSIGLPKGWKYQSAGSAGDRFTGPAGQKLLIAWTSMPKSDPVADWKNQERYMVRSQYDRIRIEEVSYRGWNTADWEFTYVESGTKYRTIDRGFVVNDHAGYALMYTAMADEWDSALSEATWRTLTGTFQPKK